MKKLLAVLLMAALTLGAFCFAEEADVTGTWYLSKMVYEDQEATASDLGITMTLILNADGTATMESEAMDVLQDGSWAMNGEGLDLTFDGDTETAAIADGYLVITDADEMQMFFGREEPVEFVAPAAATAADISEFDGTWTMVMSGFVDDTRYISAGMMLEEMGFIFGGSEPTLVIENGVVTAFGNEESETFEFENGQLVLKLLGLEEEEVEGAEELEAVLDQTIVMNEDGTITYTVFDTMFFCEKAA